MAVVVLLGAGATASSAYAADDTSSPVASEPAGGATCDPQQPPNGCSQDPGSPSPVDSSTDPGSPSPTDPSTDPGSPSPSDSSGEPSTTPPSTDPGTVPPTSAKPGTSQPGPGLPSTGGTLPRTGGGVDSQTPLLLGIGLLAAGGAVLTSVRPRRRH